MLGLAPVLTIWKIIDPPFLWMAAHHRLKQLLCVEMTVFRMSSWSDIRQMQEYKKTLFYSDYFYTHIDLII